MIKNALTLLAALVLALPAAAQTTTTTPGTNPTRPIRPLEEIRKELRGDLKGALEERRAGIMNAVSGLRDANREKLEAARETFRKEMETRREEFREKFEEAKEKAKAEMEAKREEFRERLGKIKDDRRRQLTERIENQLRDINSRRGEHFTSALASLDAVLDRIVSRRDKAADRGLDVAAASAAIEEARKAIAAARAMLTEQAGKTYGIAITSDDTLRGDVSAAKDALETDLVKIRDLVRAAHEAVRKAAVALAQIPRVDDDANASETNPTGSSTNQ